MDKNVDWIEEDLEKIAKKVKEEIYRIGDGIPYIPSNNRYIDMSEKDIAWWTNGFWAGINWQLFLKFEDTVFKECAEVLEEKLDKALEEFVHLHHDVGFMWLHTAVANYRLTKNDRSYQRGLHAASILASRYNLNGAFLRAWNDEQIDEDCTGWVIIDSMMNIPLLYWASGELNDSRFKQIAMNHANTVAKHLVRDDGSVNHIGVFDAISGVYLHSAAGQGYSDNSSWSRGQGWAIYGFALSYGYTENKEFLNVAKRVAHYVMSQLIETDYIARVDFRAPKIEKDYDTSASSIIACGLLELSKYVTEDEKDTYVCYAISILKKLSEVANWDSDEDGIIPKGTVQYHGDFGHDVSLIYADCFYIEGLLKLKEFDRLLW